MEELSENYPLDLLLLPARYSRHLRHDHCRQARTLLATCRLLEKQPFFFNMKVGLLWFSQSTAWYWYVSVLPL